MPTIPVFSEESMRALQRDHERLRLEIAELRVILRAAQSQLGDDQKKPICRFTLDAALTTAQATKAATITHQYGPGLTHTTTAITVQNFLTKTAGTYEYHGASGAAGKAFYNPADKTWHIFDMECPAS